MKYFIHLFVLLCLAHEISAVGVSINKNTNNFKLTTNVNNTISLHCEVFNNIGNETLIWYREKSQVDIKPENSVNSSYVCISPATHKDDGVKFTCLLQSNNTIKVTAVLDIKFSPMLSGDDNVTVEVGKTAELTCNFYANPLADMFWRKNGNIIPMVKSRYTQYLTSDSLKLSISNADKSDGGIYTCLARTSMEEVTRDFILVVEDRKDVLPIEAIAAAVVVGALIILFGMFARREKILKHCMKTRERSFQQTE
ncbi:transmembrane and immunoglobulin domain-containing protein 1 [Spea bombifrons]|uniref:transmembrane and immunoglobulin domain-containing protein 1 n=1 Tax=Spea bombifrons TaxID=233779 RepID=UPI00234B2458|nr:transmembrane and immunoglobulin domain-containing protein 1 [Spea bombifrons]